jgi:hypothetical protein
MSDDLGGLRDDLNAIPHHLNLRTQIFDDGTVVIGRDWFYELRGWWDAVRCLLGRHRNITIGCVYGDVVCRCSCGAIRYVGGSWFDAHPFRKPRNPDQELSL